MYKCIFFNDNPFVVVNLKNFSIPSICSSSSHCSEFKNPFGEMDQNLPAATRMNAVTDGGSYSSDNGVGYVRLQTFSAKAIRIGTCYAIPCWVNKNNYNYFESDVNVVK